MWNFLKHLFLYGQFCPLVYSIYFFTSIYVYFPLCCYCRWYPPWVFPLWSFCALLRNLLLWTSAGTTARPSIWSFCTLLLCFSVVDTLSLGASARFAHHLFRILSGSSARPLNEGFCAPSRCHHNTLVREYYASASTSAVDPYFCPPSPRTARPLRRAGSGGREKSLSTEIS